MFRNLLRPRLAVAAALATAAAGLGTAGAAWGQEGKITLPPLQQTDLTILYLVLGSAIVALLYGAGLAVKVLRRSPGSAAMQEVSRAIQQGARAYLTRQAKTMVIFIVIITLGLYFMYRPVYPANPIIPIGIALSFLLGSCFSWMAGALGMWLAVRANVRVAHAALSSFKRALETAFQAGTVAGMFTLGAGLLGATAIFLGFKENAIRVLVGFGFGGSLVALFMRIGGGIYTKAADVGADLVGKVEQGIPEDDPRNAATIADNVGDNVGDCAGMAADVFESYEVTLVAAIILGFAYVAKSQAFALKLIIYPLIVRAVGVFASMLGTWLVKGKDGRDINPMRPINIGFYTSAMAAAIGFGVCGYFFFRIQPLDANGVAFHATEWWRFFLATFMGIVLAMIIGRLTEYYTHTDRPPVTEIAYATRTGPATMILTGIATGLESSVWAIIAIAATIFGSMAIFGGDPILSMYGIALSGLGLLTTTGMILAMDTYGPISDNANGIFEMSGALKEPGNEGAGRIVHHLDAVGNTTKALTKGFAIATAVIAATSLFKSYIDSVADKAALMNGIGLAAAGKWIENMLAISYPEVFIGVLIGGAVPFLFSCYAIRAVSRAAFDLVEEVRRQFREIPGIMEFKNKPDYSRCVEISTKAAQKELLGPALLAICTPVFVAFALGYSQPVRGVAALAGYLVGAILTGQLMAVFLSNTGGAWDNAKKKIEDGLFGGKGTPEHKASVIGDTVGDPFKDTAGPALNPLIKVMNLVGILIAPIAITPIIPAARIAIVVVSLGGFLAAYFFNRRGGIRTTQSNSNVEAPEAEDAEELVEPRRQVANR
jgi:K(+)-stimulated pyrophosphate-energized sodium pump